MKKMLSKVKKRLITVILAVSLMCSVMGGGKSLSKSVTIKLPAGMMMTMKDDYTLYDGVVETKLITNNIEGNARVSSYAASIEMSSAVKIIANYGTYYNSTNADKWDINSWKRSRTTSQATRYAKATGNTVLVAINGDYFNMGNGKPSGALVINGVVYSEANGRPYFAIMNNGTAGIFAAGSEVGYNVEQAVGGGIVLIKDGNITAEAATATEDLLPVTSIGIKDDGTVVMYEVDGRDEPYSVGMTISDQAKMLQGMGCVDALLLDAGGSSSFATTRENDDVIELRNNPSDGTERAVASTLMVVLDVKEAEKLESSKEAEEKETSKDKEDSKKNTSDKTTNNKSTNNKTSTKNNKNTENTDDIIAKASAVGKPIEKKETAGSTKSKKSKAAYIKYKNGSYKITDKKKKQVCFVKLSNKNATILSIPATIKYKGKTYKVVKIATKACMNNKKLVKLTVSKKISNIGKKAFYGCTNLKKVSGIIL